MIADKAYYGHAFETRIDQAGIDLLRKAGTGKKPRAGQQFFKPLRQVIESVNATFKTPLDIERHRGKTISGATSTVRRRAASRP